MKKHSFIIAAAAMAAAVVLGTACTRKPAVETMETVTTEAPTEETTKPQPTATQPEETSAEAPQYKEMYHMLQGTVTKVTISVRLTYGMWRLKSRRTCRLPLPTSARLWETLRT